MSTDDTYTFIGNELVSCNVHNCPTCGKEDNLNQQTLKTEEKKVCNTTVETKARYYQKFSDLVGNQFIHGGDKYAIKGIPDREATDIISAVFGGDTEFDWVLGTMMKYLFRFKNFHREKDLLKISTYCYILWLKQGNHLKNDHDEDTKK